MIVSERLPRRVVVAALALTLMLSVATVASAHESGTVETMDPGHEGDDHPSASEKKEEPAPAAGLALAAVGAAALIGVRGRD